MPVLNVFLNFQNYVLVWQVYENIASVWNFL